MTTDHELAGTGDEDAEKASGQPVGRSAAAGVLWFTAQKWVVRMSGFLTLALLTRLISPADFGVVAAASVLIPIVLLLADLGFSTYIVQSDDLDQRMLSTGFWFSVTAGLLLSAAMALTAPLLATAFNIEGSSDVLRSVAFAALIMALGSMPTALLRRQMRFKLLAIQATVAAVIGQVVAIAFALAGTGAWALVVQLLASQALMSGLAWRSAGWYPTWCFSRSEFRSMARFGVKVVAVEAVTAGRTAGEAAIIANALGPAALGYVNIAQRLVLVAQDASASAVLPVSTVAFAKVRSSRERLRGAYRRSLAIVYTAASPLLAFVAVGAPLMVPLLFGSGWEASAPVAQALAVAAILVLGAMVDHGLHYGVGAPGRWLAYAIVVDALTLGTTFLLAPHGLTFVALGFMGVALVATAMRWVLVGGLLQMPARLLGAAFFRDMTPVTVAIIVGLGVRSLVDGLPAFVALAVVGISIAATHLLVARLVNRRVLVDVLDLLPLPPRLAGIRRLA